MTSNLSDEEFLFRTYSYLVVAISHLSQNFDLHRRVRAHDLVGSGRPHWGSLSGVSATYAARRVLMGRMSVPVDVVLGTGHAGLPALVDAFVFGGLRIPGFELPPSLAGFDELSRVLSLGEKLSSEVGPNYPFPSFPTGNLGHGLGYAQGYALANPDRLTLAVIGDGECEAGSTLSALISQSSTLAPMPMLVPIVNLNGFRMGGPSALSNLGFEATESLFASLGFDTAFVDLAKHNLSETLEEICALRENPGRPAQNRILCLYGQKGYSGPASISGRAFVGQPESHKSPVLGIKDREEAASIIDTWLRSYKVQPFRADGGMHSRFERLLQLPKEPNPRPISSSSRIAAPDGGEGVENGPPIRGLQRFIVDNCESESGFKVFSPDEGSSNLGSEFIEEFLISPHEGATGHPSSGHLVEILNEDLCLAWLVGWRMAGKHGLMVTYEAFAPILVNQILQIIKFNREWKTSDEPWPFSLTVVVSSLGWRNSSSHHEPFFTDSLAHLVEPGVLEIIFPIDAISTANALHSAQKRASGVSIIVLDKHAKHKNYQYSAIDYLSRRIRKLGNEWTSAKHRSLVVSIGNIAFQQANVASEQFAQMYPDQSVTHFCCENMALIFGSEMESSVEIRDLLAEADKVVWVGNGRARALLNEVRFLAPDTIADSVLGFLDQDRTRSGIDRITTNAVDAAAILKALTS